MLENEAIRRAYHGVEEPITVAGNREINWLSTQPQRGKLALESVRPGRGRFPRVRPHQWILRWENAFSIDPPELRLSSRDGESALGVEDSLLAEVQLPRRP